MRFIKLYEKITEWEWYDDTPTFRVFTHLLLTANWKDTNWHGIKIKRGQRVISFRGLAKETGLTERQVRTAIEHLKSTHELTQVSTHHYTTVTIENYEKYQGELNTTDTPTDTPTDTAPTSDIEYIELIEDKEKNTTYSKRKTDLPLRKQIPPTVEMVRAYCLERGNNVDAEKFCDFYESKNWFVGKNKMKDWQAAVRTWEKQDGKSDAITKTQRDLTNVYSGISQEEGQKLDRLFGKE